MEKTQNSKKLVALSPLALMGVTLGTGSVPLLETSDITTLASAVGSQITGLITNAFLIAGVGLIVFFGFYIANKIFRIGKIGGRRRR